jgi:hypothetical protein
MRPHLKSVRTAIAALLIVIAPAAQSVMYRWVDLNGAITYSDQPPSDPAQVRQLTVIDSPAPMTPHEKRTLEIIEAERAINGGAPVPGDALGGGTYSREGDSAARDALRYDSDGLPRTPGDTSPQATARPSRPEAARDPCLRSSDPRCYEKNRNAYVPYLGYAPSAVRALQQEAELATGAIGTAPASGSVGGTFSPPRTTNAPQRRSPGWQLRNALKDAKDLK